MPCGWEGNRRSGVALAMRYRLQWFIHLRAHGLRKADEHAPRIHAVVEYGPIYVYPIRAHATNTDARKLMKLYQLNALGCCVTTSR